MAARHVAATFGKTDTYGLLALKMKSIVIVGIFALGVLAAILLSDQFSRRVIPQKSKLIVLQYSATEMNRPAHAARQTGPKSLEGILPAEALNQGAMRRYQDRVERNIQSGDPSRPLFYAPPAQLLLERVQ